MRAAPEREKPAALDTRTGFEISSLAASETFENSPAKPTPQARWQKANPLARWAHLATASAIKKGILIREGCAVCGASQTDFHHDPRHYDQPLRGIWLCRRHHVAEHRRLRQESGTNG